MNPRLTQIASLLTGVGLIVAAIIWRSQANNSSVQASPVPSVDITQAQLAAANGRQGQKCYVAIDGIVYEIKDSPYWVNGYHTTSQGKAYCGFDLSKVIDQAPHGRSVLDSLPKVGRLAK